MEAVNEMQKMLHCHINLVSISILYYTGTQGSSHTGREWSAPTTTQQFLAPLRLVLPPLTEGKKCWNAM